MKPKCYHYHKKKGIRKTPVCNLKIRGRRKELS